METAEIAKVEGVTLEYLDLVVEALDIVSSYLADVCRSEVT